MAKTIYSPELRALTQLLREAREAANLTQVDLSLRLNRPQSFVSKYETGQRRLDIIELRAILVELDVPFIAFMRRYDAATR